VTQTAPVDKALVRDLEQFLGSPVFFKDVLARFSQNKYRDILRAWSEIRSTFELERDESGRYWIKRAGVSN
jgi:hypothetical protein